MSQEQGQWVCLSADEWPFGPPRWPVKKEVCKKCGRAIWLEITPEYLLAAEANPQLELICQNCARAEQGPPNR